jgi:hypothetical protein
MLCVTSALTTVRGGASLGPLDAKLALNLSKGATVAYFAGSAFKYINKQVGNKNTDVSTILLSMLFVVGREVIACFCLCNYRKTASTYDSHPNLKLQVSETGHW